MERYGRSIALLLTAASAAWFAGAARAESAGDYQKMFDQWSTQIADIQQSGGASAVAREVEGVRTLLGQAQAFVASEKFEEIGAIAERATVLLRYAQAKATRVEAEQKAAEAEETARSAELAAERAKAEADAAASKYAALEKRGL